MPTNRDTLNKGIKYLIYAVPMIFIGPSVIYNAFMNQNNNWHYLVLAIGCLLCLGAMYFIFKGIKTITDAFFDQ